MPDDPVTLGELARRLRDVHRDLKEDIRHAFDQLESKVSKDILSLELQAKERSMEMLAERIAALEQQRKEDLTQRRQDRRSVFAAMIAPLAVAIILAGASFVAQVWGAVGGGGP